MKKTIFILLTILLCGCVPENGIKKPKATKQVSSNYNTTYNVVEIDSCEYLVKHNSIIDKREIKRDIISITHKGNCKYCQERNRKMIEEVLTTMNNE